MIRQAAIVAVLGVACEADPELPPVVWEGQHLRYRTDEPVAEICAGTFEYLDYRVGYLATVFDRPEVVVDYSWTPGDALSVFCPSDLGCAENDAPRTFSKWVAHEHELTHALRAPPSHRALEEGIAVAFGDSWPVPGEIDGSVDDMLRDADRTRLVKDGNLPRLGHFVSYVAAEYGLPTLVELSDVSSLDDGYSQLVADFDAVTSTRLADAINDYEANYPICDTTRFRYDGVECSRDAIPGPAADGERLELEIPIGCSDDATIGPQQDKIWKTIAINVPADGRHELTAFLSEARPTDMTIAECGASCFDAESAFYARALSFGGILPCLRTGTYLIRVEVEPDVEDTLNFELTRLDHSSCE